MNNNSVLVCQILSAGSCYLKLHDETYLSTMLLAIEAVTSLENSKILFIYVMDDIR